MKSPGRKILTAKQIDKRVKELGKELTRDYKNKELLIVGILKGSFIFISDLCRSIDLPVEFDFIALSSYENSTASSGIVRIVKDLDIDITGRHVLLVEDIIDSGLTFDYIFENMKTRHPESLEMCSLLHREGTPERAKYCGFHIASDYVIGYGLDAGQKWRNLSDIHAFE